MAACAGPAIATGGTGSGREGRSGWGIPVALDGVPLAGPSDGSLNACRPMRVRCSAMRLPLTTPPGHGAAAGRCIWGLGPLPTRLTTRCWATSAGTRSGKSWLTPGKAPGRDSLSPA